MGEMSVQINDGYSVVARCPICNYNNFDSIEIKALRRDLLKLKAEREIRGWSETRGYEILNHVSNSYLQRLPESS